MSAFDMDQRVRDKAQTPITLGGTTFNPVRRDWKTLQALSKVNRKLLRLSRELEPITTEIEKLTEADVYDEPAVETASAASEAKSKEILMGRAESIAVQLIDADGKPPTAKFIFDHGDPGEMSALSDFLDNLAGDEDSTDPTN